MGAPLLSDSATPSCRKWRRAWLERPRRDSKYVPQTSHLTGCEAAARIRMRGCKHKREYERVRVQTDRMGKTLT